MFSSVLHLCFLADFYTDQLTMLHMRTYISHVSMFWRSLPFDSLRISDSTQVNYMFLTSTTYLRPYDLVLCLVVV